MVDYARDVIFEPYFRTQVKVFVIAALFMYLSIFLIYLFGRAIVFPILFLRMSVNGIATTLSSMIKGKLRFSPDLLQYKDRVNTRDEIKLLSNEVSHMTTVIRGVIPYISASTLKHSERETPTTERRNLTFLFTDIRGFTTISESMTPDKVVEMLNHYLDLQSTIIHDNGGDVDKFVGDEIMAMFEGPKKELNACKASLEIRKAMAQEKELAERKAEKRLHRHWHQLRARGLRKRRRQGPDGLHQHRGHGEPRRAPGRHEQGIRDKDPDHRVGLRQGEGHLPLPGDRPRDRQGQDPARPHLRAPAGDQDGEREAGPHEEGLRGLPGAVPQAEVGRGRKGFAALVKDYKDETSEIFLGRVADFRKNPPPKDWDGVFHRTSSSHEAAGPRASAPHGSIRQPTSRCAAGW